MKKTFLLLALALVAAPVFAQTATPDSSIVVIGSAATGYAPEGQTATKDLYVKGQVDAELNYKKYKGAAAGTLIASLVSPLVGLIPAIACSATHPKIENLGYPDANLFMNKDYHDGYTKKAKRIKSGKVWKNWGIGFGVNLVAVLLISASAK
jgi:hypothetical protein